MDVLRKIITTFSRDEVRKLVNVAQKAYVPAGANRVLPTRMFHIFYIKQRRDSQESSVKEWKQCMVTQIFSGHPLYQGDFIWAETENHAVLSAWLADGMSAVV